MYIAASIIYFKDGGEGEITVLHTGTAEECKSVCDNTHAISYSGPRPIDSAQIFWMEITPKETTALTEQSA